MYRFYCLFGVVVGDDKKKGLCDVDDMEQTQTNEIKPFRKNQTNTFFSCLLFIPGSKTVRRLLLAHGVVGDDVPQRPVFTTLDQALQKCEEIILSEAGKLRKRQKDEAR